MGQLTTNVRIFLSSTFLDLKNSRQEIARRLREIFGAQLIVMETFGSDEAPPEVTSVRRVADSDIFVGIYARRYGSVDAPSGKSITELELDEAERAFSAGTVTGILLYLLNDAASWPREMEDHDSEGRAKLGRLKHRAKQHTISEFESVEDLPYRIIRDVLSKIKDRLATVSARSRKFALPPPRRLVQPIGMEFLTSADRERFYGRDDKVRELLNRIEANPISLLLANSGAGKTSIIHAGLIPAAAEKRWRPVYTRPFGMPRGDVTAQLFSSIFEGDPPHGWSLVSMLEQASKAATPRKLLLVIDQFEDTLAAKSSDESEKLVADLCAIRHIDDTNMRVLLSYRADLEARLGRFWQAISGSPRGLPRVYLAGTPEPQAWASILRAAEDLGARLELSDSDAEQIKHDLVVRSAIHGEDGVYPPYIQMMIDHVWRKSSSTAASYRMADYLGSGGIEGVTGGFLARQLTYAQDSRGHGKRVLVSLVRSYGVKAQKSLADVASDTGLSEKECESSLERLIDLRLVRPIAGMYEVAHDFLAHEILEKLVDSEERDFKRFRELLASKASAFGMTRGLLTAAELLVLFKYKERVVLNEGELRLVLASWARESAPGAHWLLQTEPSRVAELIRAEEAEGDLDDDNLAMLLLVRRRLGKAPLRSRDWRVFRRYRLGLEFAALLSANDPDCPDDVVSLALRSRHPSVREAAIEAISQRVAGGSRKWISDMGKSSSATKREVFEHLAIRDCLPLMPLESGTRSQREFAHLQRVSRAKTPQGTRASFGALQRFRPRSRSLLFAKSILLYKSGRIQAILKQVRKLRAARAPLVLEPLRGELGREDFMALLRAYAEWNKQEAEHMEESSWHRRRMYEEKATALANAIQRTAGARDLSALRRFFRRVALTSSAQNYVLALMKVGHARDVISLIERVGGAEYTIQYWFQIQISRAVESRMRVVANGVPKRLQIISSLKGFWEDARAGKSKFRKKDSLAVRTQYNRALYLRLVAHAVIGAARRSDLAILKKLTQHEFRLISRAAAIRLTELGGDDGIGLLQELATEAVTHGKAESVASALRDAEMQALGLAQLW